MSSSDVSSVSSDESDLFPAEDPKQVLRVRLEDAFNILSSLQSVIRARVNPDGPIQFQPVLRGYADDVAISATSMIEVSFSKKGRSIILSLRLQDLSLDLASAVNDCCFKLGL